MNSEETERLNLAGGLMEELDILDRMQALNLPAELDQGARDIHRLITDCANDPKYAQKFPDLRIRLLRSLDRLVGAIKI